MKKTIIILCFILPLLGFGQTVARSLNPTGYSMSYASGITLTNSTALTAIYLDSIYANTFTPGRSYEFDIYCSISTPLSLLPNLSLNVTFGNSTLSLTSSALIGSSLTAKTFRIHVIMFANSLSAQFIYAELMGDNTGIITGSNYFSKSASFTEDLTLNKAVKVTAQFSSATGLATTTLFIDNVFKHPF